MDTTTGKRRKFLFKEYGLGSFVLAHHDACGVPLGYVDTLDRFMELALEHVNVCEAKEG